MAVAAALVGEGAGELEALAAAAAALLAMRAFNRDATLEFFFSRAAVTVGDATGLDAGLGAAAAGEAGVAGGEDMALRKGGASQGKRGAGGESVRQSQWQPVKS